MMPIKQTDEVKIKILSILSDKDGINKETLIKRTHSTKEKVNNALAYLILTQDIIEEKETRGTRHFYKFYISEHGLDTLKNSGYYVGEGTVKKSPTILDGAIEPKEKDCPKYPPPSDIYRLSELIVIGENAKIIAVPHQSVATEIAETFTPSDPKTKLKKSELIDIIAQQYEVSFDGKDVSAMKIQLLGVKDVIIPIMKHLKNADDFDKIYNKILYFLGEITKT